MDSRLSVPLLTPSTRYSEWKLKMNVSLKRQGLYEVSTRLVKEYYKDENDWINDGYIYFGRIGLHVSRSFHFLIDSAEYPKDIWTKRDRTFGKHNEVYYRNLESTFRTTRFIYSKFLSSNLSNEFFQDEEEAESSTQSI